MRTPDYEIDPNGPSYEEVEKYIRERNSPVDTERFFAYYTSVGWVTNQGKAIKRWKQAVITWERSAR